MVLIDLSEHNLSVIKGALNTLKNIALIPEQKQELIEAYDDIQNQLVEIGNWGDFRKKLYIKDRDALDYAIGFPLQLIQTNIESLAISRDIVLRCEVKLGETPKITGCVRK